MFRSPPKASCVNGHPYDESNTYWSKAGKYFCRKCRCNCERRARKERPKEKAAILRRAQLKFRYGLSESDWLAMLQKQHGLCAICRKQMDKPEIDHCHDTGKIRGMLCGHCNRRLGFIDDANWLRAALSYLRGESDGHRDRGLN